MTREQREYGLLLVMLEFAHHGLLLVVWKVRGGCPRSSRGILKDEEFRLVITPSP